jgi:hypothetical protein
VVLPSSLYCFHASADPSLTASLFVGVCQFFNGWGEIGALFEESLPLFFFTGAIGPVGLLHSNSFNTIVVNDS